MSSSGLQRPIGFSPSEISGLINDTVVEQHAEDAAFLWTMRDRAVLAPNYSLQDVAKLDGRVDAHLDGLLVAGAFGRELCQKALDTKEPGAAFAASVLAFETHGVELIEKVLTVSSVPSLARGVISALGWLPFDLINERVQELFASPLPAIRRIGIAACAVHRIDPGVPLLEAISDRDPFLRARASIAVGELGRVELLSRLRGGLADPDQNVRFGAAWASSRLSQNLDALAVLRTIAESANPQAYAALQIAIRRLDLAVAKLWQASLAKARDKLRTAVIAAGAIGDPSLVPWLIDQMNFPSVARVAGEAFSMITGVDLTDEDLDGEKPEQHEVGPSEKPDDEDVSMDLDENLRWPAPELVTKWWNKHRARFLVGRRYLLGKEITVESLRVALIKGKQRERAAAALEIALRDVTRPLFEVRAKGALQLHELKRWS